MAAPVAVKKQQVHTIADTLDGVGNELREEEDALLKVKELVLKEIGILKAEEVTIQRLLEAHSRPPNSASSEQETAANMTTTADPVSATSLPKINLDVHNSSSQQGYDGDEYDDDDDDDEDSVLRWIEVDKA